MEFDCVGCDALVAIDEPWEALGTTLECPHCHARLRLDFDYMVDGDVCFWLIKDDDE